MNADQVNTAQRSIMPRESISQDEAVLVTQPLNERFSKDDMVASLLPYEPETQLASPPRFLPLLVSSSGDVVESRPASSPSTQDNDRLQLTVSTPYAHCGNLPAVFAQTRLGAKGTEDHNVDHAASSPLDVDNLPEPPFLRRGALYEDGTKHGVDQTRTSSPLSPATVDIETQDASLPEGGLHEDEAMQIDQGRTPSPSPLTPSPSPEELHLDPLSLGPTVNNEADDSCLPKGVQHEDEAMLIDQGNRTPPPSPSPPPSPLTPCSEFSASPGELHVDPLLLGTTVNEESRDVDSGSRPRKALKKRALGEGQEGGDPLRRSKRQRKGAQGDETRGRGRVTLTKPRKQPTQASAKVRQTRKKKVSGRGIENEESEGDHDEEVDVEVDLTIPITRCVGEKRVVHVTLLDDEPVDTFKLKVWLFCSSCASEIHRPGVHWLSLFFPEFLCQPTDR